MQLSAYMARKGLIDADVAKAIGVSRATISRYRRHKLSPSWRQAKRLHDWTKGAVTPNDWIQETKRNGKSFSGRSRA